MLPTLFDRPAWDPFAEMRRVQAEMNQLFSDFDTGGSSWQSPPINLWVGDNSVVVTAEVPGVSRDDIDLAVREDTLTIQGKSSPKADAANAAWHLRERVYGSFTRTVQLPFRVDPNKVVAHCANGVLEIELQRPEDDRPRKIKINAA